MSINYKYCTYCKRILPASYKEDYCVDCEERMLFEKVRDFVRKNEVNEYQVAEHFDIPVRQVKQWIKEGRMEYKERDQKSLMSSYCIRCGARVSFGSLCSKCLRLLNGEKKGYGVMEQSEEAGKMRFIDSDKE